MVGNSNEEFVTSFNSSHGTTQMDYAIFHLGIVTNSGACAARLLPWQPSREDSGSYPINSF